METIAILGTGLIGAAFVRAELHRGHRVHVYNRTQSKALALAADGAIVASTPAEAITAQTKRVHIALSEDHAVDSVLAQCQAQLKGHIVIDHTTTSARGAHARAERLAQHDITYIHAPVFMSPQACLDAKGIMLASGPEDALERVRPQLEAMTGKLLYLGSRPDLAAAYKLFGNAMIISMSAGLADVFAIARGLGLEPQDALSLFEDFNPGNLFSQRGVRMAQGDFSPSFELTMARKDVRLMLDSVPDHDNLAVLPSIAARMDALINLGFGSQDLGVLAIPDPKASD